MHILDMNDKDKSKENELINKIISNIENHQVRDETIVNLAELALCSNTEMLRELISELMKYPDGLETIKTNWKMLINNSKKPEVLIQILGSNEQIRKEMLENISYFFKYADIENAAILAREISALDGGDEVISQNFDEFFEDSMANADYVVIPTIQTEDGKEKVKNRFEEIKNSFFKERYDIPKNPEGFFRVIKALEGVEGFEDIYEEYKFWADLYFQVHVPENKSLEIKQIFEMTQMEMIEKLNNMMARKVKDEEFSKMVYSPDREEKKLILEEVANGNEYKYKSVGSSSLLIQAGNQVVKLGAGRRKYEIPYHPRIMMPYFRKKYDDGSCLEVFNYGNTKSAKITDEVLLEIYKELENDGIIWGDARKDNLLELVKDNELPSFIRGKDFNIFGFLNDSRYPTDEHKALKAGDIVVCDLDMLYVKGDPDFMDGIRDDIIIDYINEKKAKEREQGIENELEY